MGITSSERFCIKINEVKIRKSVHFLMVIGYFKKSINIKINTFSLKAITSIS